MLLDSFRLAVQIAKSGFKPDFLVGIWRGGSAVGIAVQEGLDYFGIETDHIAIRTSYEGPGDYSARKQHGGRIRVHGLDYIFRHVENTHSMLIVDDVYSTGRSVAAVIRKLKRKARCNAPQTIKTAALWYRPDEKTRKSPDFFLHETNDWLVLPYELDGLSDAEISAQKPVVDEIVARLKLAQA